MGYIEDLHKECLKKIESQLEEMKAENKDEDIFQMDFSAVSFACDLKSGCKVIHELDNLIRDLKKRNFRLLQKLMKNVPIWILMMNIGVHYREKKRKSLQTV